MTKGQVGFSAMHRRWAEVALNEDLEVAPWDPARERDPNVFLGKLTIEVDFVLKNRSVPDAFDTDLMADHFKAVRIVHAAFLGGDHVFCVIPWAVPCAIAVVSHGLMRAIVILNPSLPLIADIFSLIGVHSSGLFG